ncbi:MAG: hypothetical protein HQ542_08150 [Bacteroidia bacterium]|nr:hypothetical protein [Bacteroidia bacterium]
MLIYRFKVSSEEHEDFLREICIQPVQTFLEFHNCILESAELFPCDQASFFLTDKKNKKNREIVLSQVKRHVKRYDEEMDEMITVTISPKLMKQSKVKDFIEDPHQRLIYEYHGKEYFAFLIELVKIKQSDGERIYPRCDKWVGEIPKKKETFLVDSAEEETKQPNLGKELVPGLDALEKLDGLEESDAELADIENNLSDFLFGNKQKGDQEQVDPEPDPGKKLIPEEDPKVSEEL